MTDAENADKLQTSENSLRTKPKKSADTVVIAMDGSEYSDYAFKFYMEQVHNPGNHVIIVHSTEYKCITYPNVSMVPDGSTNIITKEIEAEEDMAKELEQALSQRLHNHKIDGTVERIHGDPGPAIIALASEKHADYIVIGCRGKSAMRRTFTGSVTDYVTHHAKIPVMVARHKDHIKHHHGFHLPNPFSHHKKHEEKTGTSP